MIYQILKIILIFLKNKWYNVKVIGGENIPEKGGYILAVNHNDRSDPAFLVSSIKRRIHFLAEKDAIERAKKYSIFLTPFLEYTGHLKIEKNKGKSTKVLIKAKKLLEKGGLFCIFPEGTTNGMGKILKGKTGVARLSLMARKPIIPIAIKGTYGIIPEGYRGRIKKYRKIKIIIGKPMYFEKFYGKENNKKILRAITDTIMKEVKILYAQ